MLLIENATLALGNLCDTLSLLTGEGRDGGEKDFAARFRTLPASPWIPAFAGKTELFKGHPRERIRSRMRIGRSAPPKYEPNRPLAYANRRGYGWGQESKRSAIRCTMSQLCWVGENLPLTCTLHP